VHTVIPSATRNPDFEAIASYISGFLGRLGMTSETLGMTGTTPGMTGKGIEV